MIFKNLKLNKCGTKNELIDNMTTDKGSMLGGL